MCEAGVAWKREHRMEKRQYMLCQKIKMMVDTYIDEQEVGSSSILRLTRLHLQAERSGTACSVGSCCVPDVGGGQPKDASFIEEVVDQIELLSRVTLRSVDVAVEGGVSYVEGSFPHICEFYFCRKRSKLKLELHCKRLREMTVET